MLKFDHDGQRYAIEFQYSGKKNKRKTRAMVFNTDGLRTIMAGMPQSCVVGFVRCAGGDVFVKDKGRKLALKKALMDVKAWTFRKAAWDCYFSRFPEDARRWYSQPTVDAMIAAERARLVEIVETTIPILRDDLDRLTRLVYKDDNGAQSLVQEAFREPSDVACSF